MTEAAAAVVAFVAFLVALAVVFVGAAQAASCAHVSITPGVQGPTLTPKSATIDAGGCAAYTNNTALAVKVTIGKLADVANPNGVVTFIERAAGTFAVTAQQQFQGQAVGGAGTGTLVVRRAATKPSSSPPPSSHPTASSSQRPTPAASSSGPQVAPTTHPPTVPPTPPGVTPAPQQSGQGNPPVIVGIPPPTATPTPTEEVVRAQLQPPSDRATGLPAAVAALLVIGAGAAFVRVLLAEPRVVVDDGRFVPRAS